MAREKIEIMSVRSELNKIYREKYGMFWRFKRNKMQLENIENGIDDIRDKLNKLDKEE